jgi:hypothetical protein
LNKKQLIKDVVKDLSVGLTILLELNKSNPSIDDRNTLKIMSSFLGQLTLNRNKPILTRYFDYRKQLNNNNSNLAIFVVYNLYISQLRCAK